MVTARKLLTVSRMNLKTARDAKDARDLIRNEIVKALRSGNTQEIAELLKADEAATQQLQAVVNQGVK